MKKKEKVYLGVDYLKYIADESKNWDEIVAALEGRVQYFKALKELGLQLSYPVDGGLIHFEVPESQVEKYCKTFSCDQDDLIDPEDMDENIDENEEDINENFLGEVE